MESTVSLYLIGADAEKAATLQFFKLTEEPTGGILKPIIEALI
ncbi:MAG: hypothetical protein K0R73_371 [Candidatus Midichloriaceae bacterium]|jgi:hypothetical protein|nr:hypothetical protein [Candidatus Midichloriaceae bacterium]